MVEMPENGGSSAPRVLFVMTNIPPASLGGAEHLNLALLSDLHSRGWDVSLLGRSAGDPTPETLGIPATRFRGLRARSHYGYMLKLFLWLVANSRRHSLIHFVDADQLSGIGLLATRWVGVPRILRFESEERLLRERLGRARIPFVGAMALWGLRSADAVVYVAEALRTEIVTFLRYSQSALHLIPNAVDVERYNRPPYPDRADVVVCPARLRAEKNHSMLLQVWQRVVASLPKAQLWLVGDGPLKDGLVAQAAALGISDSVAFCGYRGDMPEVYRRSRVCVLLSLSEADPLVLLEACAASVPCVASRVGGIPSVIEDGVTGLLVDPDDTDAASRAIVGLLSDRGLAAVLGARAREYVVANRSFTGLADEYELLMRQLMGRGQR